MAQGENLSFLGNKDGIFNDEAKKRVVLVRSNGGPGFNGGGFKVDNRILGNIALAVGLTYLSATGQLGWILDTILSLATLCFSSVGVIFCSMYDFFPPNLILRDIRASGDCSQNKTSPGLEMKTDGKHNSPIFRKIYNIPCDEWDFNMMVLIASALVLNFYVMQLFLPQPKWADHQLLQVLFGA
ncbi:hypothetical protein POM88_004818 [Heracleum sosnowskyi]|uniref:Uncharacterized protein n=1 Tax=Heracleum sosnowskyi TaxID=360622 RepID=A0AAD8NER2_9APIA|nr:hypothetical protein POM88_004818 [Heracleum sosnowskyi]